MKEKGRSGEDEVEQGTNEGMGVGACFSKPEVRDQHRNLGCQGRGPETKPPLVGLPFLFLFFF